MQSSGLALLKLVSCNSQYGVSSFREDSSEHLRLSSPVLFAVNCGLVATGGNLVVARTGDAKQLSSKYRFAFAYAWAFESWQTVSL
jgi:hypothetical protein